MANPAVGNAVVCYYCKCFHSPNVACQFQPPGAVYSTAIAAEANVVGHFNPWSDYDGHQRYRELVSIPG